MKISVVISTFNRASFLPGLWECLVHQSIDTSQFEVLFIDNASTDNTASCISDLIKNYPTARYIFEPRQGLSYGRNCGIANSTAPYICFADDDALLAPDYLETVCDYLDAHPKVAELGGPIFLKHLGPIPSWSNPYVNSLLGYFQPSKKAFIIKRNGRYPRGSNMVFRASAFERCGGFDTSLGRCGTGLVGGEEKDMAFRLLETGLEIHYIPQAIVYHLVPEARTTTDFIRRQSLGVGKGERNRTSGKTYYKRVFSEAIKWAGSIVIAFYYLVSFRPSKAIMLCRFRWWISCGLLNL